jgi:hypothetical protein
MDPRVKKRSIWSALILAAAGLGVGVYFSRSDLKDTSSVPGAHLPVYAEPPPPAVYVPPSDSPEISVLGTSDSVSSSEQRLRLYATSPGRTSREGTASIGTEPNNPQTYAAGAMLASGALIEEIHRDHVVLKWNGSHLELYLAGIHQPDEKELVQATVVGGPGIADRPVETRADSREDFSESLTPTLVFDGGKLTGFRITPGKSASHLPRLGLASGDVIRAIDGRPVSGDVDWQKIAGALAGGTSVVLSIERSDSLVSVLMDSARLNSSADAEMAAMPVIPPST